MPSRADLAKIHIAKKELQLDDDTYRAILREQCGADSARDLSPAKVGRLLAHFKRLGYRVKSPRKSGTTRPLASDPQSKKIRAIWLDLHEMGVVKNPSEVALAAYVKRMAGVDALQFATTAQKHRVIEALKQWRERSENIETIARGHEHG